MNFNSVGYNLSKNNIVNETHQNNNISHSSHNRVNSNIQIETNNKILNAVNNQNSKPIDEYISKFNVKIYHKKEKYPRTYDVWTEKEVETLLSSAKEKEETGATWKEISKKNFNNRTRGQLTSKYKEIIRIQGLRKEQNNGLESSKSSHNESNDNISNQNCSKEKTERFIWTVEEYDKLMEIAGKYKVIKTVDWIEIGNKLGKNANQCYHKYFNTYKNIEHHRNLIAQIWTDEKTKELIKFVFEFDKSQNQNKLWGAAGEHFKISTALCKKKYMHALTNQEKFKDDFQKYPYSSFAKCNFDGNDSLINNINNIKKRQSQQTECYKTDEKLRSTIKQRKICGKEKKDVNLDNDEDNSENCAGIDPNLEQEDAVWRNEIQTNGNSTDKNHFNYNVSDDEDKFEMESDEINGVAFAPLGSNVNSIKNNNSKNEQENIQGQLTSNHCGDVIGNGDQNLNHLENHPWVISEDPFFPMNNNLN
jgi:hypothetical protein